MSALPALLIDPTHQALPLYTVTQLRALEREAQASAPPHQLMARAGDAAARFIAQRAAAEARVCLLAGPGNNGGDALVAATELRRQGFEVCVVLPVEVKTDAARWALQRARTAGVAISGMLPSTDEVYAWVVDGLFGIGLVRPLQGVFAELAAMLSARTRRGEPMLALDVPSGLNGDMGNVAHGGTAVRATHTLTFIAAKPGLFTAAGRDYAGEVWLAPLQLRVGLACAAAFPAPVWLNAPHLFAGHLAPRDYESHKGRFGNLAVVGGASGMCGAPILAARAALYLGAGKVYAALLGAGGPAYDPPHPELMLQQFDDLALDHMHAFSIGPGMGQAAPAKNALQRLLATDTALVLDADALNLIAADATLGHALRTRRGAAVITPHPLEAARLLGVDAPDVQQDRLSAARRLARQTGATVVLKGSGTVVLAPDGRMAINPTGNAGLASGGTGDVLGGMIGAMLAQRLPPFEAALAGVYLHGLAADALTAAGHGPAGTTAGELAPMARTLLNQRFYSRQARSGADTLKQKDYTEPGPGGAA